MDGRLLWASFNKIFFTGIVPTTLSLLQPVTHQYYVIMTRATWKNAQIYCRDKFTDLATVESELDWLSLNTAVAKEGLTDVAWTGLYNDINSWRWSLNDVRDFVFQMWQPGQPDNNGGHNACGSMGTGGYWWDFDCTKGYPSICFNGELTFWLFFARWFSNF